MGNGYPNSTIAQILEDIISQLSFEGESHSNIADILLSILNQTSYDKEPYSVLAELFLKLKAKIEGEPFDPYDKETHSVIADILVSILNETEYTDVPQSRIAELLLDLKEELESYTEITVSGSIVSFTTNVSKPLVKLKADVEAQQDLHGYDKPWAGGGGANKMPDVFNPLPANGALLVEYPSEISFTGLYISFVFSGKIGAKGGAFIQARDASNNVSATFTFSNLSDHNNQALSEEVTYSNELVHLSFSQTKAVKKWSFFRNWNPSNDASIKNFMLSIGNTAVDYAPYANICPITGWSGANVTRTGANLWNEQTEIGAYNNQGEKINYNVLRNKNVIMVKGLSSVYFYCGTTGVTARVVFYTEDMTCISSTPATTLNSVIAIPNNACYMSFNLNLKYGTTYAHNVSINYPSTDTAYHPFVGNPFTSFFEGLINGTMGFVDMGSLTWDYTTSYTKPLFFADVSGKKINNANIVCPIFNNMGIITNPNTFSNIGDKIIGSSSSTQRIFVRDDSFTDATEFTTAMSGVYLIYELATPTTPTITQADITMLMTAFGIDEESAIVVFGQEVFGAQLNVTTGLLTINKGYAKANEIPNWYKSGNKFYCKVTGDTPTSISYVSNFECSFAKVVNKEWNTLSNGECVLRRGLVSSTILSFVVANDNYDNVDDFKNSLGDNYAFTFPIYNPVEIQLTPIEIDALAGDNVIFADTGDVEVTYLYKGTPET